jgi:hypothetical protein
MDKGRNGTLIDRMRADLRCRAPKLEREVQRESAFISVLPVCCFICRYLPGQILELVINFGKALVKNGVHRVVNRL